MFQLIYEKLKTTAKNEYLFFTALLFSFLINIWQTKIWFLSGEMFFNEAGYRFFFNSYLGIKQVLMVDLNYIALPQRLFSFFCVVFKIPHLYIPYIYSLCAIIMTSFFTSVFTLSRFRSLIKNDYIRCIFSIVFIFVGATDTKSYINFSYYYIIPLSLFSLQFLLNDKIKLSTWVFLLSVFTLSKPFYIIFIPCFVICFFKKNEFREKIWLVLNLGFLVFQVYITKPFLFILGMADKNGESSIIEMSNSFYSSVLPALGIEISSIFFSTSYFDLEGSSNLSVLFYTVFTLLLLHIPLAFNLKKIERYRYIVSINFYLLLLLGSEIAIKYGTVNERIELFDIANKYDLWSIFSKLLVVAVFTNMLFKSCKSSFFKKTLVLFFSGLFFTSAFYDKIKEKFLEVKLTNILSWQNYPPQGTAHLSKYCNYIYLRTAFCNKLRLLTQFRSDSDSDKFLVATPGTKHLVYNSEGYYDSKYIITEHLTEETIPNKYEVLELGMSRSQVLENLKYEIYSNDLMKGNTIVGFFLHLEMGGNYKSKFSVSLHNKGRLEKKHIVRKMDDNENDVVLQFKFSENLRYENLKDLRISFSDEFDGGSIMLNNAIVVEWYGE